MIVFQLFLIKWASCSSLILFLVLLAERQLEMCSVSAEWIFNMHLNFSLTHVLFYAKNTETHVPHLFRDCQWYQKSCILGTVKRGESSLQCSREILGPLCWGICGIWYWWDTLPCQIHCSRMWLEPSSPRPVKVFVFVHKVWLPSVQLSCWTFSEASKQLLLTFSSLTL